MSLEEALALHSEPYVPGHCRLWLGWRDGGGYGQLRWQGGKIRAHRAAWIVAHGPIPPGTHVLHHCDTPACINAYDCLFLGTDADNVADMIAKGRRGDTRVRGEANGLAKLTAADVLDIRAIPPDVPQRIVAAMYDVDQRVIWQVRRGVTWNHV